MPFLSLYHRKSKPKSDSKHKLEAEKKSSSYLWKRCGVKSLKRDVWNKAGICVFAEECEIWMQSSNLPQEWNFSVTTSYSKQTNVL